MKRNTLLELLASYTAYDGQEEAMRNDAIAFIAANANCFNRELLTGHVTGSAWIVNKGKTHALMIHHMKLGKWFQPGGHCDGNPNVLHVARKEAIEETGLSVVPLCNHLFDIDNHIIPERKGIPQHTHYDMRFLFEADKNDEMVIAASEVKSAQWIALDRVSSFNDEPSILRMVAKTIKRSRMAM